MIDSEDFHDLVREDAAQVKGRQETDSIPIIDDLRFLVSRKELLESHKRLQMIDNLLDKLGLEAWSYFKRFLFEYFTESLKNDYATHL